MQPQNIKLSHFQVITPYNYSRHPSKAHKMATLAQQQNGGPSFSTINQAPITVQRPVPADLDKVMRNPGAPRANFTVDKEHPQPTGTSSDQTVLQQHVAFWDGDNDGVIWPSDTYRGFHSLGFNPFLSTLAIPIIHGTFSYWTSDSWIPDPRMPIKMKNAHRMKHGSDSETYDTEGRYVPEKFEEIFSKYDRGNKGGLSLSDIQQMIRGNRNIMDPVGWIAGWLEWNTSYYLAAQETPNGKLLLKEDVRAIIEGNLFQSVAQEIKAGRLKRASVFRAGLVPLPARGKEKAEAVPPVGKKKEKRAETLVSKETRKEQ